MPTPQEARNQHCREIINLIKEFKEAYDSRPHDDPENLKTLRQDVFQPIENLSSKQSISLAPVNDNFTPQQENELVGIMQRFRNEIDMRINLKSSDRETRDIHTDAMRQINMFSDNYPKDSIDEITVNPSASVKMQNALRDKVQSSTTKTNRNGPRH